MPLGPTLVTLGAILGKKSHFYGLKSPIFVIIWSLRTNIEIYIKIDFYLMREYAQCATTEKRAVGRRPEFNFYHQIKKEIGQHLSISEFLNYVRNMLTNIFGWFKLAGLILYGILLLAGDIK